MRCGDSVQTTFTSPSVELPGRSVVELFRGPAPALPERAARGEALEAVAVIRARALKRVSRLIVRDSHMPELGMKEPMQQTPVRHAAAADARPDGDVAERVEADRSAPALLAKGRGVHVGVERDG